MIVITRKNLNPIYYIYEEVNSCKNEFWIMMIDKEEILNANEIFITGYRPKI
jgi:hypothetical protein